MIFSKLLSSIIKVGLFKIHLKKNKEEYAKKYIKIQYIRWDSNLCLKDNTVLNQSLRPIGHAESQRNKPNYYVIILNMLKEKSLSCQSRERVFWQLLIVSCQLTVTK